MAHSRTIVSAALFSIVILLIQVTASAQSASFTRTDYPTLGNNHIAADFNGDGILDLAGTGTNAASVMLGNGDGTFRPKVNFAVGGQAQDLAAGDFNGDGRVDLVVSLNDTAFSLSLLTGNGDGTFNAPVNFDNTGALEDSPAVVATDLDNDGRLDVVLAHAIGCFVSPCVAARTITVMLGFGDGTFQLPFDIEVGTGMSRIAVGDFNRDGIKDLGIAGDNSRVYTLLGVGNGTFLQQPTITLTADTLFVDATDVDIADLNGDTIQDLVVAVATNGSRTAILLGNGDGTFQPARILTEPRLRVPQYQVIADFNRDGFQDLALALANGTEGLFEIRNGNGDGTFGAPILYAVPPALSSVGGGTLVTGDFNRDGRSDIALPIIGANPGLAGLVNSTGAVAVAPAYGNVTATPSTVVGGSTSLITISLIAGSVAPSNGFSFSVSSSNSTVLQVPSSVFMPRGSSSVRFTASTRNVTSTQSVTIQIRNNQLGRRNVSVTVTPAAPTPAPLSLTAVTLSPASVVGGNSAQGTVTLSAAAPAATVVTLAGNNAAATVPASVTVAAGASSASFAVTTGTVNATMSAIISGTFNGVTRSSTLTINPVTAPPPPSTDTVRITRAEFDSGKRTLRVEATSTSSSATLRVFVTSTGQLLGTLSNNGGGQYRGELSVSTNPQNITVRSSLGGVATASVIAK
ncbi:MAG TPA: VCBS repeat-containing protein [Pyrinomonadaceae bacterium]|nr:VCBS repeat-containing protein [Pyrinomonadaceae bacterium]